MKTVCGFIVVRFLHLSAARSLQFSLCLMDSHMVVMECHKFSFFDKNDECMMRACTRFAVPCIFLATHDDNPYQMKPK